MRTISKGENNKEVEDYKEFRDELIEKIGCYCSYCEMKIDNQPEIDHVVSKSVNPGLKNSWDNLLLACKNCNSIKSDKVKKRAEYYFPDEDNTSILFSYLESNEVIVREELSFLEKRIAERTLDLFKPNRLFQKDGKRLDRRWEARREAYGIAKEALMSYESGGVEVSIITLLANSTGFPSLWSEIFNDYPNIVRAIYESFKGTDLKCFDELMNPIRKVKGKI